MNETRRVRKVVESEPTIELVCGGEEGPYRPPRAAEICAKRMRATTYEVDSSHVPMLSHPRLVIDVIRAAAKSVRGSEAA